MDVRLDHVIAAVVTLDRSRVAGGAPIFFADNDEDLRRIATYLSKIMDGVVHDLGHDTYIVVRH